MHKTFALIATTRKEQNKIKTKLLYEASEEALINYIPGRNEPITGEQRMAAASIPGSRAPGELSEIGRLCGVRGKQPVLSWMIGLVSKRQSHGPGHTQ